MKKIFTIVLVAVMLISINVFCFAETIGDPVTESIETIVAETSTQPNITDEAINKVISAVTSATFWTALISFLFSIVGLVFFVKNKFSKLFSAIGKLATHEKTSSEGAKNTAEIKETVIDRFEKMAEMISAMDENYKTMMTVLTVFVENTKMNGNAKAEILDIITNIKPLTKSVPESISEALAHIKEANLSQEKISTPALDAAISASIPVSTPSMSLD